MNPLLKTVRMIIKSIVKFEDEIQWTALFGRAEHKHNKFNSFFWFWTMHVPYLSIAFIHCFYRPLHKNIMYNHKVWDGQTPNDFRRGNLIEFVYKLGGIKQLSWHDEDDGRGYFIGYSDEDEI